MINRRVRGQWAHQRHKGSANSGKTLRSGGEYREPVSWRRWRGTVQPVRGPRRGGAVARRAGVSANAVLVSQP